MMSGRLVVAVESSLTGIVVGALVVVSLTFGASSSEVALLSSWVGSARGETEDDSSIISEPLEDSVTAIFFFVAVFFGLVFLIDFLFSVL